MRKQTLLVKRSIGGEWERLMSGSWQKLHGYVIRKKRNEQNGDSDTMYQRLPEDRVDEFLSDPDNFDHSTV